MRRPIFEDIRNKEYWNTLIKDIDIEYDFSGIEEFNIRFFSKKGVDIPYNGLYACDYAKKYTIYLKEDHKEEEHKCIYCPYVEAPFRLCGRNPVGLFQNMYGLLEFLKFDSCLFSLHSYFYSNESFAKLAKTCKNNLKGLTMKTLENIRDLPIRNEVKCRSKISILRFWE